MKLSKGLQAMVGTFIISFIGVSAAGGMIKRIIEFTGWFPPFEYGNAFIISFLGAVVAGIYFAFIEK